MVHKFGLHGDEGIRPIGSQSDSSSVELDHADEIALAYMFHFDQGIHIWTPPNKPTILQVMAQLRLVTQ